MLIKGKPWTKEALALASVVYANGGEITIDIPIEEDFEGLMIQEKDEKLVITVTKPRVIDNPAYIEIKAD